MYGKALLYLARLVGLRQVDIAAHFGITKAQINYWAKGVRPIPPANIPTLIKKIAEGVAHYLHGGKTDRWVPVPGQPGGRRRPTRVDLGACLNACFTENFARRGYTEYPTMGTLMEALEAYARMPIDDPKNAVELAHATRQAAQVHFMLTMLGDLRQLFVLLDPHGTPFKPERTEDAHGNAY